MPATNYKGEESEQSKARKKPPKKPKPWYLGFGLAKWAGSDLKKSREQTDKQMADAKK